MINLIRVKHLLFLSAIAICLLSCDTNRILDENEIIANSEWAINDVRTFTFDIVDKALAYNLFVNVRNTSDYDYRNLYLFIEMSSPSNKYFMDTVEVKLANSKGKWVGNGIGNVWQNQIPLLKQVKLVELGTYKVSVTQGMRHDTLKGISDIGVRVEKAL